MYIQPSKLIRTQVGWLSSHYSDHDSYNSHQLVSANVSKHAAFEVDLARPLLTPLIAYFVQCLHKRFECWCADGAPTCAASTCAANAARNGSEKRLTVLSKGNDRWSKIIHKHNIKAHGPTESFLFLSIFCCRIWRWLVSLSRANFRLALFQTTNQRPDVTRRASHRVSGQWTLPRLEGQKPPPDTTVVSFNRKKALSLSWFGDSLKTGLSDFYLKSEIYRIVKNWWCVARLQGDVFLLVVPCVTHKQTKSR